MPQVVVTIDGKTYRMACAEGEEQHLEQLAAEFDGRVAEMRGSFGEIGDIRLTVMAGITVTDELSEARRRIAALEAELGETRQAGQAMSGEISAREAEAARLLDAAADSVETILSRLTNV
ncbi:cell division protein ZapA [Mangrovicella endophytica]|uniref:cell division protein ZapA n=1 Tax=Mangrovicella endophytica TaxID=2066697 RepID=UPI000C9E3497|nr:cell division protein ZapA [Mangrovicella endophytica]